MTVSVCVRAVTGSQLRSWLSTEDFTVLLLDCRSFLCYNNRHITQAYNVHCPQLLRKRRSKSKGKDGATSMGLLPLDYLVPCPEARAKLLAGFYKTVLVYDDDSTAINFGENPKQQCNIIWVLETLLQLQEPLLQPQAPVEKCFLVGGFNQFSVDCPSLCVGSPTHIHSNMPSSPAAAPVNLTLTSQSYHPVEPRACKTPTPSSAPRSPRLPLLRRGPALSLPNLKCTNSPAADDYKSTMTAKTAVGGRHAHHHQHQHQQRNGVSSGGLAQDCNGPVLLLPHLYLGSNYHASSLSLLEEHGITAVLNVSRLPNYFPTSFRYMQIPVDDSTDADLLPWFEEATDFIESVERGQGRVLVHCHAGISRSATICLAYLMKVRQIRLEEAFEFVRSVRTIISPNFSFMIQLLRFQDDLASSRKENMDANSPCNHHSVGFFGSTSTSTMSSMKYHTPPSLSESKAAMPSLSSPALSENGSTATRQFCLGNSALLMKRMSRSISLPLSSSKSSSPAASSCRMPSLAFDFNLSVQPKSGMRSCSMECADLSPTPSPVFSPM